MKSIKFFAVLFIFFFGIGSAKADLLLTGGFLEPDGSRTIKGGSSGGILSDTLGEEIYITTVAENFSSWITPPVLNVSLIQSNNLIYSSTGINNGNLFSPLASTVDVGDVFKFTVTDILNKFEYWGNAHFGAFGLGCRFGGCGDFTANLLQVSQSLIHSKVFYQGQLLWAHDFSTGPTGVVSETPMLPMLVLGLMAMIWSFRRSYIDSGGNRLTT
ncbi:MAG: hypothetical protein R3B60_02290 [Candidatus Paceibacterota bacterium]